jgi:[ribosomal protein S5]-alanine N-acetyltransferase
MSISTSRLHLRPAHSSDLSALHEIMSHPECMQYWSTPPHTDISQTKPYLASMIESPTNGVLDFAIELRDRPGHMVGKAGLWDGTEIGVLMARDVWGRGYAREALGAIIDAAWGFEPDGKGDEKENALKRVEHMKADVDPRNKACLALLKKVGFKETGREERTFLVSEEWVDSVYLELERPAESEGDGRAR